MNTFAIVLVLAHAVAARPAGTPAPAPTPTRTPPPNPFENVIRPSTVPRELGAPEPRSDSIGSLGSRVKLNRKKAGDLFRQDVVPGPVSPSGARTAGAVGPTAKSGEGGEKDVLAEMMAADRAAEKRWREREANRRSRLASARVTEQDVCARYAAAANSAGTGDGWVSDAAGAVLGALLADCNTAARKANEIEAEKATLEEECRSTQGCQPGWLR